MAGLQPKPEHRYQYFKEVYNTLITLSSGMVIASVAYVANVHPFAHKAVFAVGLGILFLSIVFQILILLTNAIGSGFDWDFMASDYNDEQSGQQAQFFGRLSGYLLTASILLTFVGFVCMWYFVSQNL